MDKKNMEKIDMLYELVAKRNRQLEERYKAITESLFSPDMKKIMQTLREHYQNGIKVEGDKTIWFIDIQGPQPVFRLGYSKDGSSRNSERLLPWDLPQKEYNDSMIDRLGTQVNTAKRIDEHLTFIEDHMEDFVNKISELYAEYVERESDKLDELLREMDHEMYPTKHLKVTVEWV